MFLRFELTRAWKPAAAVSLLLFSLTGCRHPKPEPPPAPPNVTYNEKYDAEIKQILSLGREGRWEDARTNAEALYARDPKNPIIDRVHSWVGQQTQQRRQQALEDKIRDIDAKHSVFNPTVQSLITEKKDRGLPARKDVRDAVDRIENTPYIPETYGKTIHEKGPLF